MFHAYLLAFCGRVVFRLSPVAAIVLRGHLFFFFFYIFKHLADVGPPEVLWVHATMSICK